MKRCYRVKYYTRNSDPCSDSDILGSKGELVLKAFTIDEAIELAEELIANFGCGDGIEIVAVKYIGVKDDLL